MPAEPPENLPLPDGWETWDEKAQQEALDLLRERQESDWRPFFCPNPQCDGEPHDNWDFQHARAKQRPPKWSGDWLTHLAKSGRGTGKTRMGSEITHRVVEKVPSIALIGATGPAFREIMVEDSSGILATAKPGNRPTWEPSRRRLVWPNGAVAHGVSAEEPDRIRGLNVGWAWLDEAAFMDQIDAVWDNLLLALRIGANPHVMVTTTPRPTPWMKALAADPKTVVVTESTYANLANLSPVFREQILAKYEGTRLGRQELHGEILEDVVGALWSIVDIERSYYDGDRDALVEGLTCMVGVDPPSGAGTCGIVVVGRDKDNHLYVLDDYSVTDSTPRRWAEQVVHAARMYNAGVVAEQNQGGRMVEQVLIDVAADLPLTMIPASMSKEDRAQPIALYWEAQRQVGHMAPPHPQRIEKLVTELIEWVPKAFSPDRLDAMVHACTALRKGRQVTGVIHMNDYRDTTTGGGGFGAALRGKIG